MQPATALCKFNRSMVRVNETRALMPGGVGSDFRLGISPTPLVIQRADGPYVFDIDGNQLIDYYLGMGPMILGHTPPAVVTAVCEQLADGILFAGQSELEYRAAELVIEMVPCAERVRFGSSGTEAIQLALRLARAATGRTKVLAFRGHYHGWLDNVSWAYEPTTGSLLANSRGQDPATGESIELLEWNDADVLGERLAQGDIACVLMEPTMCNSSSVLPAPGYLEFVRDASDRFGCVLAFDEVITGFRVGPGGAQGELGVTPDLAVFGKALASGFPVSCVAGRADIMDQIGGPGHVIHAGTYNGQAAGMAATVATLESLRDGTVHERLRVQGAKLRSGIVDRLSARKLPSRVQGWPSIFHVSFGSSEPIVGLRSLSAVDKQRYRTFTTLLLERGVRALERGAWFISSEHDDDVISRTLEAVDESLDLLPAT